MKLYFFQGLAGEIVPKDITHVIIDRKVTVIKWHAFRMCRHRLVSIIMGDNVKRIEMKAFAGCYALRFIRLSKTLEYIGYNAFKYCYSLEALFLPSTVKEIGRQAFSHCRSLRLLILPNDIDLSKSNEAIIFDTSIFQIAEAAGVEYEWGYTSDVTALQVNKWLMNHMDEAPFHKLCYNPSVTASKINAFLNEVDADEALEIDPYHGMTPLHMLSMNPHAPADTIAFLFYANMEAAFCVDNQGKTVIDYATEYNVGGLISMINILCNHRSAQYEN